MNSYCLTDVGLQRNINQDFVYASDQPVGNLPNLYIVADGMGGHAAGDYASRCAVETMVDFIQGSSSEGPVFLLGKSIHEANRKILEKASKERSMEGMGTTVVAACVVDGILYVANVGDSRLYLLDDGIMQVTRDHSLVEEMVRAGQLARAKARTHPEKNVITRAVGVGPSVAVDFFDIPLRKGETFLMCSDGLSNMVEDSEMIRIVRRSGSLEEAARTLIDTANRNGGSDNISAVLGTPDEDGE